MYQLKLDKILPLKRCRPKPKKLTSTYDVMLMKELNANEALERELLV